MKRPLELATSVSVWGVGLLAAMLAVSLWQDAGVSLVHAQSQATGKTRAKHPDWRQFPVELFYKDAFSEGLVGPRPKRSVTAEKRPAPKSQPAADPDPPGYSWSGLISRETIEDEIKVIGRRVDAALKNAGHFKGRGYHVARREFSMAAMLFAIIHQYDQHVRWRSSAPVACNLFGRAARNAKIGTDPVFHEARQRQADLNALIRGSSLSGSSQLDGRDWSQVCDREPLMARLEEAEQDRLAVWLAADQGVSSHRDRLIHEAELVAAVAQVLVSEGMQDADDAEYQQYGKMLRQAASDLVKAVKGDDVESARQALGRLRNSCHECHDMYRA